ncbi:hypothetical protein CDN99_12530 [Roseateles aquatilis]|jgi:hypothetical protein|uniref:DUF4400 domain-containing protein n=1 Tax=Roseateles aquatilis TaxID=431061 RepID=A0A246JE95_9BURK|nr:DUF4400 domain-containing protein [Roseateles aquatilis]MBY0367003.1 DUF4400 domain-containing protein [Burkholderiaceae bacterium]OWQ90972.1 hypothetical protein CDN99_12530 [Roseateles aquatilis]
MIRYVWITAMLAILCIVLYIPSAVPPERFLDVLRSEHALNERVWGEATGQRILGRMLDMQQAGKQLSAPPTAEPASSPASGAIDTAVAQQMSAVSTRLFGNPYFRSIDALFVLVTYRLSALVELLPLLLIFCGVVAVDGLVLRQVRAREFVPHSAELFGGSVVGGITLGSVVVVACFLPMQLHPMFITLTLLLMLFVLSRALANYHAIR